MMYDNTINTLYENKLEIVLKILRTMSGNTKNLKDNANNLQQMVRSTTDNQVKTSIPITIVVLILALIPFIISLALIFKDAPTQYNIKFTLIRPRSMLYYDK